MAAGNATISGLKPYRLETATTQYKATLGSQLGTITNTGTVDVEIILTNDGTETIGSAAQGEGQITLKVGMTVPIVTFTYLLYKSASAGEITYMPYRG